MHASKIATVIMCMHIWLEKDILTLYPALRIANLRMGGLSGRILHA